MLLTILGIPDGSSSSRLAIVEVSGDIWEAVWHPHSVGQDGSEACAQ